VEMGQGVYTSQAMCIAEELDVGLDQVLAAHAPPDQANYGSPVFIVQATGGSTTTSAWFLPLRRAGASARAMLLQAAAMEWGVEASGLSTDRGMIFHKASGRSLRYGEVASKAARLKIPTEIRLKDPSQFRLIGTPARRIDTADKTAGKTVYGIDVVLPGTKFATLKGSPVLGGKVSKVDQAAALPRCSMHASVWPLGLFARHSTGAIWPRTFAGRAASTTQRPRLSCRSTSPWSAHSTERRRP
jgi:isoquinoline 1-oxidoreductase beta subunit